MSAGVAALIAHVGFWFLLAYGWFWDEIGATGVLIFVLLWLAGYLGVTQLPYGDGLFVAFLATLDIVLVFLIFKGDVPLT